MKKYFALLLVLCLLLPMFAYAEMANVAGQWELRWIEMMGIKQSADFVGLKSELTLDENGAALCDLFEGSLGVTGWHYEDGKVALINMDGEAQTVLELEYTDDTLAGVVGEDEYAMRLIYERKSAEQAENEMIYDRSAIQKDPAVEAFYGSWEAKVVEKSGIQVPIEETGTYFNITVDEKQVSLYSGGTESFDLLDNEYVYRDGALIVLVDYHDDGLKLYMDNVETYKLQLQEDGRLFVSSAMEGLDAIVGYYYMEKVN